MTCCAPLVAGDVVRKVLLFLLYAVRVAIIVALIYTQALDLHFYTYLSFTGVTILQTVGLVGLFVPVVLRFYARFLFPVAFQSAVLVAVLITILVQLNESIFSNHLLFFGGDLTIAQLHLGDWVTHQLPLADVLINVIAIGHLLRGHVRSLWLSMGAVGRAFYAVWVLEGVLIPLGLYAAIENWAMRYPTSLPPALSWMLIVLVAGIIGAFFLLFLISADDYPHYGAACAHAAPCGPCARAAACAPLCNVAPLPGPPPEMCGGELVMVPRVQTLAEAMRTAPRRRHDPV